MLFWILGGLAVVVAVPFVIGSLLPERHAGRTTADFDRPPADVWEALMDVGRHPMTGRMMRSVTMLPDRDGRPAWEEDMGHGEVITVTTAEREPPRRLVREMASGATAMRSRWEYTLEPVDGGCRVTLDGVTDIPWGTWHTPLFRFMMVVGGGVKKGLDIQLGMVRATLDRSAG